MEENILKFSEFLDSYKNKYRKTSSEISIPKDNEIYGENKKEPLVSSNYMLLDFDSMCDDAKFYPKRPKGEENQPSTVDGLYYRVIDDNLLEFFLIEFKSFDFNWNSHGDYNSSLNKIINNLSSININKEFTTGINRLNTIKNYYGNTIEFSLRLKPFESLFIVLPKIYEEYCESNKIDYNDRVDLYNFFKSNNCLIKLIIVGKSSYDPSKDYLGLLGGKLKKQYERLDFVNILSPHKHRLCFKNDYEKIIKQLNKDEHKNIKSLNFNKFS